MPSPSQAHGPCLSWRLTKPHFRPHVAFFVTRWRPLTQVTDAKTAGLLFFCRVERTTSVPPIVRWWWSCFSCPREGDQQAAEVDMQHRADGPASKKVRVVASSDRAPLFVCDRCTFTNSPPVAWHRSDSAQFEVNPLNRPRPRISNYTFIVPGAGAFAG